MTHTERPRKTTARAAVLLAALLLAGACAEKTAPRRTASVQVLGSMTTPLLVGPGGGQSRQLTVRVLDQLDEERSGRTVTWGVATPAVISVTQSGLVTAVGAGLGTVTATVDGVQGSLNVSVLNVPIASLTIDADTLQLERSVLAASSIQLPLTVADSTGAALAGRTIAFISSAPGVASIASTGRVTAVSGGSAVVRAIAEGFSDSAVVIVTETEGLPADFDIAIVDAQWTQGAQTETGSIPMLRNGRAAVVNVRTHSEAAVLVANDFVLRIYDIADAVVHTETTAQTIPSGTSTAAAPTVQFLVPASVLQPGVRWQVERDPLDSLPDASAATDVFPAAPQTLSLITAPLLRLRFVPISLAAHGNVTPNITEALIGQYVADLRRLLPHGEIETVIGPSFVSGADFGTAPQGGSSAFWLPLLTELDQQRVADPANADAHWIGVVRPPTGFTFVVNGGWGFIPSSGGYIGPASRTFTMVDYDWANNKDWVRSLLVHELGHNLGRRHAPSCGAPGADIDFPTSDGTIGAGAHDTYSWEQGLTSSAPAVPSWRYDLMGYCLPIGISAYTYEAMVEFRGDVGTALVASPAPERVLFVRGHVEGRSARIDTALVMNALATPDNPSGPWLLEGRGTDGQLLFRHRFALGRYDHSETLRPFGVTVPITDGDRELLTMLRLTGPTGSAERRVR